MSPARGTGGIVARRHVISSAASPAHQGRDLELGGCRQRRGSEHRELQAGGLVGDNSGTIQSSFASATCRRAMTAIGRRTGRDPIRQQLQLHGCRLGDGRLTSTPPRSSIARDRHVTVGATSVAGGLVGTGDGIIAGQLGDRARHRRRQQRARRLHRRAQLRERPRRRSPIPVPTGSVTSTGPNSIVGGFVGLTGGTISISFPSGAVTGTSDSYLGGFAGVNLGIDRASFTTPAASVTGTGDHDVIGGFVGANFGSIEAPRPPATPRAPPTALVGGFAGINARFINFAAGLDPGSSFPSGASPIPRPPAPPPAARAARPTRSSRSNDPTSASNPPAFPSTIVGAPIPPAYS